MQLHNKENREVLKQKLMNEPFKRRTISFYRYFTIENPQEYRDLRYMDWFKLNCLGRIYIAREGINAQMSIPDHNLDEFLKLLDNTAGLQNMPIKYAIEDDGKSFFKLTIKVRPKLVADGLDDDAFDLSNVGKHLSADEFHYFVSDPNTLVVDMRNHYETEIGHFQNAYLPDADTFREALQVATSELENNKNKKILLYCTGGIRCEKASAYFKHKGFKDVNQLHGGIIEYAQQMKQKGETTKFVGKNFVFDDRLGESIDGQIISHCHQCGKACDTHTNCANNDCHLLFIQCEECRDKYEGCCTSECQDVLHMPEEQRIAVRKKYHEKYADSKIFSNKRRFRKDKLVELHKNEAELA